MSPGGKPARGRFGVKALRKRIIGKLTDRARESNPANVLRQTLCDGGLHVRIPFLVSAGKSRMKLKSWLVAAICLVSAAAPISFVACSGGAGLPDAVQDAAPDVVPDVSADVRDVSTDTEIPCGYSGRHMIPGPCEQGHDDALAAKALRYDRCWRVFNAAEIGVNTDVRVALENTADREMIDDFIMNGTGWEAEFETIAGRAPKELITSRSKTAGLYVGAGIVADAFRYGVLRDQGYPVAEVNRARTHLQKSLELLHVATAVTGVPGVIARGLALTEWGVQWGTQLVPLEDEQGNPLPAVKNNGAWRADNSPGGQYPQYIWEDSCSRDMLVGWAAAFGAAWEVIATDPDIPEPIKATVRQDAKDLGHALMTVRESGYDLEVPDADGRTTLHGWLNEHNIDGLFYVDEFENPFHASMALGIVAAYAYASGDPELNRWLHEDLIGVRELPRIAGQGMEAFCDTGYPTNFSNVNMAMMGFWLAQRYIDDPAARATLRVDLRDGLYDRPDRNFQPADHHYSFYDFTFAASEADASAFGPAAREPDSTAMANGLDTLKKFHEPPYWDHAVVNCPAYIPIDCKGQWNETEKCSWEEMDLTQPCIAVDGVTELTPAGCKGWKCTEVVSEALPWEVQRPTNYHWRSPPHEPNSDGDGSEMLPGVDFRFAYWLGRWTSL